MLQSLGVFLVGVATSLIAGLLLQWKGDQFINRLKSRPTKRRIAILSATYVKALKEYPYGFVHDCLVAIVVAGVIALGFLSILLTYAAFAANSLYSLDAISEFVNHVSGYLGVEWTRWIMVFLTIAIWVAIVRPVWRTTSIEVLVPYASRGLERLRKCVEKCGSPEEFLAYLDAEQHARSTEDLRELFRQARAIIGDRQSKLTDQFLASISDSDSLAVIDAMENKRAK